METRNNCKALVRTGPREGLPCSVFAGSGIFSEYCFHHVPENLTLEEEDECAICYSIKKVSWVSGCPCKIFYCKDCLVTYQHVKSGVTKCPTCDLPMNDFNILARSRAPRSQRREIVLPPLPSEVVRDFTFTWREVPCSVSELSDQEQREYFYFYQHEKLQYRQTFATDMSVLEPVFDFLRKKRVEKVIERIGSGASPLDIVTEYEKIIAKEDKDMYSLTCNEFPTDKKAFPYDIVTIYWVAKWKNNVICIYSSDVSTIGMFIAVRKKSGWKTSLGFYHINDAEITLAQMKQRIPYFYYLYRVDAREYWANFHSGVITDDEDYDSD